MFLRKKDKQGLNMSEARTSSVFELRRKGADGSISQSVGTSKIGAPPRDIGASNSALHTDRTTTTYSPSSKNVVLGGVSNVGSSGDDAIRHASDKHTNSGTAATLVQTDRPKTRQVNHDDPASASSLSGGPVVYANQTKVEAVKKPDRPLATHFEIGDKLVGNETQLDGSDDLSGFGLAEEVGKEDEANGLPQLIDRMDFSRVTQYTGWTASMFKNQLDFLQQLKGGPNAQEHAARLTREGFPVGGAKQEGESFLHRENCRILSANAPWKRDDLLTAFTDFQTVYKKRPVGFYPRQRIDHSFWIWFHVRRLQPRYVIETSVKWGHATFLIRNAAPATKIIGFSPTGLQLRHWDREATYYVGPNYSRPEYPQGIDCSPWKDFNETDWSFIPDKREALVVFADDRDHWLQYQHLKDAGFTKAIFDENMAPLQGYRYSLKKICDETGGLPFKPWKYKDNMVIRSSRKSGRYEHSYLSLEEHRQHRQSLLTNLSLYVEMPPLLFYPSMVTHSTFHLPTNTPGNRVLLYLTVSTVALPLIQTQEDFERYKIRNIPMREFWFYRNPAYVELRVTIRGGQS